jgi:enoyl-CoA hydratase/carnithine racemase
MKKNLIVMGAFVFASLILASCGSNGNSGSTELKTEPKKDSVIVKKDSATVKTEDFKEGAAAFLEKRVADFKGN